MLMLGSFSLVGSSGATQAIVRPLEGILSMRCNFCDGSGLKPTELGPQPCEECGGCGVAHCCDGLQACCEIEAEDQVKGVQKGLEYRTLTAPDPEL